MDDVHKEAEIQGQRHVLAFPLSWRLQADIRRPRRLDCVEDQRGEDARPLQLAFQWVRYRQNC